MTKSERDNLLDYYLQRMQSAYNRWQESGKKDTALIEESNYWAEEYDRLLNE